MAFIETRLSDKVSYGFQGGPQYLTKITRLPSGQESRNRERTYPIHIYQAEYGVKTQADMASLLDAFRVSGGMHGGFRIKDWQDFKSCGPAGTIAFDDQSLGTGDGATLAYQSKKTYTFGAGSEVRLIKKTVSGTELAGIGGVEQTSRFSFDSTTGILTFSADIQKTCTGATSASPTELTFTGHGLTTGDTAYFTTFTGDWAALNGNRYVVTVTGANTLTIPVNASGFTAYSANGGQLNTIPQTGESVTAGFEFDVPVRFDTDQWQWTYTDFEILSASVPLIEVRL